MKRFEIALESNFEAGDLVDQLTHSDLKVKSFTYSDTGSRMYITVDTDELGVPEITQRINDIFGISVVNVTDDES